MAAGVAARLAPVPRQLSASCGTCVRYQAADPCAACMHADLERIVRVDAGGQYTELIAKA